MAAVEVVVVVVANECRAVSLRTVLLEFFIDLRDTHHQRIFVKIRAKAAGN